MYSKVAIFLLSASFASVQCWPSGAPEGACESMTPSHGNNRPKPPNGAPFVVSQSTGKYQPGDKVVVTVRGHGASFKGLMVQAFDPNTFEVIGKFEPGRGLKMLDSCSSVSHSDRKGKRAATLVWQAPANKQGNVAFRATLVQRFSEYWAGIPATIDQAS
ncbi:putative ferric-chelate reductase 1 -like protein [Halotydeus destructor]|nr:putative ferric-chelate reductase 1 -like protein [Halotydeus destructor]